jgi:Prenyltransferase and squalene oxidase repeat
MRNRVWFTIFFICSGIILFGTLTGLVKRPLTADPAELGKSAGKGLLLLQKSGYIFINRNPGKCVSCHHNTLTCMAAEKARQKGIPLIDSFTSHRVNAMEKGLQEACNPNKINELIVANFVAPYVLLGLHAEKYPANFYTDITVDYLISQANPDGSFLAEAFRVPLETGNIHLTAMAVRAIQLYAPPTKKARVEELVARSKQWLEQSKPEEQQELAFQLLGLDWCGSTDDKKIKVAEKLKSMQHPDGGWSQLPTMKSDAYATGQALYALFETRMVKSGDESFQNGINYLLKTQDKSGAWLVESRSYPIQPFFNSDFPPYDENQFISAAATNWAILAIMDALPDKS